MYLHQVRAGKGCGKLVNLTVKLTKPSINRKEIYRQSSHLSMSPPTPGSRIGRGLRLVTMADNGNVPVSGCGAETIHTTNHELQIAYPGFSFP